MGPRERDNFAHLTITQDKEIKVIHRAAWLWITFLSLALFFG